MSKLLWGGLGIVTWCLTITLSHAQQGSVIGTVTDTGVTANLITSPLSSTVNATAPGGYSGGSVTGYNASTNTYYFGYTQQTIAKTIAINQALQGSGVQVNGVQYGMSYLNGADSYGTLGLNVTVSGSNGTTLQSYSHAFNTQNSAWQQFNQTQTFTNPYTVTNLGNVSMSITGQDSRFWAGYYGPQVKDPYLKLTYGSDPKTYYNIADDGWAQVNLPFTFPFYGRTFTTSYFFSNGVVGFLNPNNNSYCCEGVNLAGNPGSSWNFAIYALQTDLIASNTAAAFYTQTDGASYMKYQWQNINEYGTNNLNSFSATIKPTGYIGLDYQRVNVRNHRVTSGVAGDISQSQYSQYYNGAGSGFPIPTSTVTFTGTEVVNPCLTNPLYSTSCPGYTAAYFSQQCTISQLYDTQCPGYAAAYLTQQCSANPLYSTQCPGYQQAYYNQQCSANPLYDSGCTGYATAVSQCTANPLSHTYCPTYQTATADCSTNGLTHSYCPSYSVEQQLCSIDPTSNTLCANYQLAITSCQANPFYASYCAGYQTAITECNSNPLNHSYCPTYQTALNTCASNPLSNTLCAGYQTASTECNSNQLLYTYCPAYKITLAACATNTQSNVLCPGYNPNPTTATSSGTTGGNANTASTTTPNISVDTSGTVSTSVSSTGNSTVDKTITSPTTTANSAAAPAAPVQLVQAQPASAPPAPANDSKPDSKTESKAEQKSDTKSDSKPDSGPGQSSAGSSSGEKKEPAAALRQQVAAKREEARRSAEAAAGDRAQKEMDNAASFAAQVAVQNVIVSAMGFNPGFDVYRTLMLQDAVGYRQFEIYKNQQNVDNQRMLSRLNGASDQLHTRMIEQQYRIGE